MKGKGGTLPSADALLAASAQATAVFDGEQRLVFVNDALLRLFGIPAPLPDGTRGWLEEQLRAPLETSGEERVFEHCQTGIAWKGWRRAQAVRQTRAGSAYTLVTIEDVSARSRLESAWRESEERLKAVRAELARTDEDLHQFALAVSHELQEPLRILRSMAERLTGDAGESANHCLEGIHAATERILGLINGLLAYWRAAQPQGTGPVCDSGAALQWAVNHVQPALTEAGARLERGAMPLVGAGFDALAKIFEHLLTNALKYRGNKRLVVRVSAEEEGEQCVFCVADNGLGIPPEFHDGVFRIFKRLHGREVPGAGVGLALCRRIVEGLGGRMWLESQPGEGSRFFFSLPKGEPRRVAAVGSQGV